MSIRNNRPAKWHQKNGTIVQHVLFSLLSLELVVWASGPLSWLHPLHPSFCLGKPPWTRVPCAHVVHVVHFTCHRHADALAGRVEVVKSKIRIHDQQVMIRRQQPCNEKVLNFHSETWQRADKVTESSNACAKTPAHQQRDLNHISCFNLAPLLVEEHEHCLWIAWIADIGVRQFTRANCAPPPPAAAAYSAFILPAV